MKLSDYIKREVKTSNKELFIKTILKILIEPQFNAVFLIRCAQLSKAKIIRDHFRRKLIKKYGVFIGNNTEIGIGLTLGHPNGIIIGDGVKIGDDATIYQQVTLGVRFLGGREYPTIGNGCTIYAGAKVIGNINIGDRCVIGANAVVTKSCPSDSILKGVPAVCTRRMI